MGIDKTLQRVLRFVRQLSPMPIRASAVSKLGRLKRQRFRPEETTERVAKALAALYEQESIILSAEEWKQIAEDPDIEDQF